MAERLTDTLFSATDGEQVELVGPCDIERAASAGASPSPLFAFLANSLDASQESRNSS